jgi:mRNA-degrading endonuclease RelE of RelBE toxin-antitoxin system
MIRPIEIHYRKKADNFFAKNSHVLTKAQADQLIIKAVKRIYGDESVSVDLKKIVSMDNYFRIRKGDVRIVFSMNESGELIVSIVDEVGYRGGIYKK